MRPTEAAPPAAPFPVAVRDEREATREGTRRRLHAVAFDDPHRTLEAVKALREAGFEVHDVHAPFPVHGIEEALGLPPSRLGRTALAGGLLGAVVAFGLQVWTHAFDWPLVIGGKSPLALPSQVPVSFELTVLFAAIATVAGLLARRRLFPRVGHRPPTQPGPGVTDDRFVVVVVERDASYSAARFDAVLAELSPVEVTEGWRVL